MARRYTHSVKRTVTTAEALIEITAASGKPVKVIYASITPASNATNQLLEAAIQKASVGATATTRTPVPLHPGDAAMFATVKDTVTVVPTFTAATEVGYEGFSSLSGWRYFGGLTIIPGEIHELRMVAAPGASIDLVATIVMEE